MAQHSGFDVLVIGEALVDLVDTGDEVTERAGGSPANVALGLGRLGARVALLTRIGRDPRGDMIAGRLEQSGVVVLPQSFTSSPTSTATATIGPGGHATYSFEIDWDIPVGGLPDAAVLHVGSIAAFLEPGASSVREILRAADAREITFDANVRPALLGAVESARTVFEDTASLATVVKLSDEDAAWLYPGIDVADVLQRVLGLGPRLAIATLGEHGSLLVARGISARVPGAATTVADTIGAGDSYMASIVDSLLQTRTDELTVPLLTRIGARAGRAAAITVSRTGADLPWRDQLGLDE
ncbi:PfkB family carbohydrate kinase [Herbiconiux sp. L3-i23]|uniref:PfkB family carbohydrate kinase n=1 Tax=Herbiconiux sp. L3-i23 TaxID=2905871 RepID=UPI0020652D51|nr:PfkB family carbohydrate kinase [Herbiconiux sp. L3-i23]BDI23330.1 ribokinase [Herbiconiux sp. L3-i23]